MKKNNYFLLSFILILGISCNKKKTEVKQPVEQELVETVVDTIPKVEELVVEEPPKKAPEIRYTVQIGSFRTYGQSFEKIPNVIVYYKDGLTKYGSGNFPKIRQAINHMYDIEESYPDSFVQALKDGEPISIKEAEALQ